MLHVLQVPQPRCETTARVHVFSLRLAGIGICLQIISDRHRTQQRPRKLVFHAAQSTCCTISLAAVNYASVQPAAETGSWPFRGERLPRAEKRVFCGVCVSVCVDQT